ncbi:MAG: [Clostridia bacterium]|nr:[FeFe] hydrogenase H-cluster radical SAM maturase HydE [Clostridia bacterium]
MKGLIDRLSETHTLSHAQYVRLIEGRTPQSAALLAQRARETRERIYGKAVYIRGLIEISNICKNDCLYCGIRRGNRNCQRYRLGKADILSACAEGYALGFRTFVLQGGEDAFFTDDVLCDIVRAIKSCYPDCAVTLSVGERSRASYAALREAGADRYLLRHETANALHYARLHPKEMSFDARMRCLHDLRELGYQVGCGFMVGSPYQTAQDLAMDLKFIEEFQPQMAGIGPFIPHAATVFAHEAAGSVDLTCFLLSVIRLMHPSVLLPATTALGTLDPDGREKGILAGANVVMPNLSPASVRKKYELYNNKLSDGDESAQCVQSLKMRIASIGYRVVTDRGDYQME